MHIISIKIVHVQLIVYFVLFIWLEETRPCKRPGRVGFLFFCFLSLQKVSNITKKIKINWMCCFCISCWVFCVLHHCSICCFHQFFAIWNSISSFWMHPIERWFSWRQISQTLQLSVMLPSSISVGIWNSLHESHFWCCRHNWLQVWSIAKDKTEWMYDSDPNVFVHSQFQFQQIGIDGIDFIASHVHCIYHNNHSTAHNDHHFPEHVIVIDLHDSLCFVFPSFQQSWHETRCSTKCVLSDVGVSIIIKLMTLPFFP